MNGSTHAGDATQRLDSPSPLVDPYQVPPPYGIIIPTYNAAGDWPNLSSSLALAEVNPSHVLIIDSSSSDGTAELAQKQGYRLISIPQREFNHGATRQLACSYFPGVEKLIFITQDVLLTGTNSVKLLVEALDDPCVGAAYGRQIPRPEANPIERHARMFNYPQTIQIRTLESRAELGFKTTFFSNSFAIYRRTALQSVGGFPDNVLLGEDSMVAARMLLAGWKIVYKADAEVIHSHPFRLAREASRYFDIGAHYTRESWILESFGKTGSEGLSFVRSEMRYLLANAPQLIPLAILRTISKLVAYRLGEYERFLPTALKKKIGLPAVLDRESQGIRHLPADGTSQKRRTYFGLTIRAFHLGPGRNPVAQAPSMEWPSRPTALPSRKPLLVCPYLRATSNKGPTTQHPCIVTTGLRAEVLAGHLPSVRVHYSHTAPSIPASSIYAAAFTGGSFLHVQALVCRRSLPVLYACRPSLCGWPAAAQRPRRQTEAARAEVRHLHPSQWA